jgi:hypothetical protein
VLTLRAHTQAGAQCLAAVQALRLPPAGSA